MINYLSNEAITSWSTLDWVIMSVLSNVLLFIGSVIVYVILDKVTTIKKIQETAYPIAFVDVLASLLTVVCNAIVFLLGVFLWKQGIIELSITTTFSGVLLEVIGYILLMDFLMYAFHYLAHQPFFYNAIHAKHHTHIQTNYLSLFVLHPLESLGFGCLMLLVLILFPFSMPTVAIYIVINAFWGTIGHFNREVFPVFLRKIGLGTTKFHNDHHLFENKNYGFYTIFWDRLFKTLK